MLKENMTKNMTPQERKRIIEEIEQLGAVDHHQIGFMLALSFLALVAMILAIVLVTCRMV